MKYCLLDMTWPCKPSLSIRADSITWVSGLQGEGVANVGEGSTEEEGSRKNGNRGLGAGMIKMHCRHVRNCQRINERYAKHYFSKDLVSETKEAGKKMG